MRKTLVILANSVKHHQHCVAGKDLVSGQWIRPVVDSAGKELPRRLVKYHNPYGRYVVKPLLKIEMDFLGHAPLPFQPENYVVNPDFQWRQQYSITYSELADYFDTPECLWPMGYSSFNGMNDRVPHAPVVVGDIAISQSLYLIKPEDLRIRVTRDQQCSTRLRAVFGYRGEQYDIAVTDPRMSDFYEHQPGEYLLQEVSGLCLSLGQPYEGYCYKLAVAIL